MSSPDPARLERLLERQQLTILQLAELIDVEPYDLRMGLHAGSLPASALARLADLLGEPQARPSPPPANRTDRATVGAHLTLVGDGVVRDDLAHALGWTLDRLERALLDLDGHLGEVGIRIVATRGRLKLAGALNHITPGSRHDLLRTQTATDVPVELAIEIYRAQWWLPIYGWDQWAREVALRHGLLARAGRDRLRITEPVRFSLFPDSDDVPQSVRDPG